jgi:4-amino-4-deoxy-L-arabinose transferase-like glycosyltransferase
VRKTDINGKLVQFAWWALAIIAFTLVIAIRIRLLGIPLERDEGEYGYAGQLMLQGIPPYKLAYNMKFPGTYAAYALVMSIFGQTIVGIHIGLLLINAASIILIFFIGRRLFGLPAGVVAAATYAVLSLSPSVLGLAAHASQFAMLPILAGTLLLVSDRSDQRGFGREFASGALFGIGVLMKQPAAAFIFFGAASILCNGIRRRATFKTIALRISIFGAGAIIPFGLTCLILWQAGVFEKFWFWTVNYAAEYGTRIPLRAAPFIFSVMAGSVIRSGWALWILAALGLVGLWNKASRGGAVFLLGLLAVSLLALSAGFYFREHYFIFILPAVSLLCGLAISMLSDFVASRSRLVRFTPVLVFCIALTQPILAGRQFYFEVSTTEACRIAYGSNPFPESLRIAEYLRDHSSPSDTIAILGSEPQIYFYSRRHSATGYIYTYALMEAQSYARQMQEEMISEIELERPRYLISVTMGASWSRHSDSEELIFTWANEYLNRYYKVVGLVNTISADRTDYYFEQVPTSVPEPGSYILIYERRS